MSPCDNCCAKIFNPKHYNLKGIGSPYYGNCILIPNIDYNAYKHNDFGYSKQVEITCEASMQFSSTGELSELVYFCPLIRCNELVTCKLDKASFNRCLAYYVKDVMQYDLKYILLLGESVTRMLDVTITDNLNNVFVTKDNRMYFVNYSPLIKFIDTNKYNIFVENLGKWINAISNKNFSNYNIIKV